MGLIPAAGMGLGILFLGGNKGDKAHLSLFSQDAAHGFYLDGYGLKVDVKGGGDVKEAFFIADKIGKPNFCCSTTCWVFHPSMIGKLIVEPNRFYESVRLGMIAAYKTTTPEY